MAVFANEKPHIPFAGSWLFHAHKKRSANPGSQACQIASNQTRIEGISIDKVYLLNIEPALCERSLGFRLQHESKMAMRLSTKLRSHSEVAERPTKLSLGDP